VQEPEINEQLVKSSIPPRRLQIVAAPQWEQAAVLQHFAGQVAGRALRVPTKRARKREREHLVTPKDFIVSAGGFQVAAIAVLARSASQRLRLRGRRNAWVAADQPSALPERKPSAVLWQFTGQPAAKVLRFPTI